MNFFEQQDQARQKTWLLIVLFSVAVLFIIGLTVALVTVSVWGFDTWTNTALDSRFHSPNVSVILKTAFFVSPSNVSAARWLCSSPITIT